MIGAPEREPRTGLPGCGIAMFYFKKVLDIEIRNTEDISPDVTTIVAPGEKKERAM
jgi:hypothetical protein